jgi:hypothetical protein
LTQADAKGGNVAMTSGDDVIRKRRVRQMDQRISALGRQTMEFEILKEALDKVRKTTLLTRSPLEQHLSGRRSRKARLCFVSDARLRKADARSRFGLRWVDVGCWCLVAGVGSQNAARSWYVLVSTMKVVTALVQVPPLIPHRARKAAKRARIATNCPGENTVVW